MNHTRKGKSVKRTKTVKYGGDIGKHKMFMNIESIGFEVETTDLVKLNLANFEYHKAFVNSFILNFYLEQNFQVNMDFVYIINEPTVQFKITNDNADDSSFNVMLKSTHKGTTTAFGKRKGKAKNAKKDKRKDKKRGKVVGGTDTPRSDEYESEEEEDDDDEDEEYETEEGETTETEEDEEEEDDEIIHHLTEPSEEVLSLHVPPNPYLKQKVYNIYCERENRKLDVMELYPFQSLTDTEYICTFYKPNKTANTIKTYLFKMIKMLQEHLSKLKTIDGVSLHVKNKNKEDAAVTNIPNKLYVLPNTNLYYYNSAIDNTPSFDINSDLSLVLQMTFGVNINYLYRVQRTLMILNYTKKKKNKEALNYIYAHLDNEYVKELIDLMTEHKDKINLDLFFIDFSYDIANKLVNRYTSTTQPYRFTDSRKIQNLKSYLYIILYRIVIYLNSYIENESTQSVIKYYLSYALRHSTLNVYKEIKRIIYELIETQVVDKSKEETNQIVETIIATILRNPIVNKVYYSNFIKKHRKSFLEKVAGDAAAHIGDPLYSVTGYFEGMNEEKDILKIHYSGSTEFEIKNDTVIMEHRDFPTYSYLDLFMTSNDEIRDQLIKNKVGTITIGTLLTYMNLYNYN